MSTTRTERPGWRWTPDEMGLVIYSILVTFLILSWAYIPA
jgi:hypothetical protein